MKAIKGKKIEMSQKFKDDGRVIPVTVIQITSDDFSKLEAGKKVKVTSLSKGKGFQGVVKRHGFSGSPASHGHKDQLRMPGSIGATGPARVFKGTKMPGRIGGQKTTIKNLEVIEINKEKKLLYLKGAVPGGRNTLLKIYAGS